MPLTGKPAGCSVSPCSAPAIEAAVTWGQADCRGYTCRVACSHAGQGLPGQEEVLGGLPGQEVLGCRDHPDTAAVLCLAARPPRWSHGNEWARSAGRHASASPGLA